MRLAWFAPAAAALILAPSFPAGAEAPLSAGGETPREAGAARRRALRGPIEKALRGGEVGPYTLERAVISMESSKPPLVLRSGRGVEGGPEDAPAASRNIYIMRFGAEGAGAEELEVLKLQQETLGTQREMMRSVRDLAERHVSLGAKSARIEGRAREMIAGMASSRREVDSLRGQSARTDLRASELNERTADAAGKVEEMAEGIAELEGKAKEFEMHMAKGGRGMRGGRGCRGKTKKMYTMTIGRGRCGPK